MDPKAMYKLTYGLFVLTVNHNGKDNGCIINTAAQVTSNPNRISIAVNKANHTHDIMNITRIISSRSLKQHRLKKRVRPSGDVRCVVMSM